MDEVLHSRVDPAPLALTRVMLGAALIIVSLESSAVLHGLAEGRLVYPFFDWVPRPPDALPLLVLAAAWVAGVCLIIGLLPHVMAAAGALTGVVTLLWDQQTYSSHLTLLTILLILLTWSESDRRFGVSGKRHRTDEGTPLWPQLLMMTQVSTVYFFAGLSKVQPIFLSGDPLEGWMWPNLPHWVFVVLAWATVVTEVGLAFALWVPRLRLLAAVVGVALHLSIITLLDGQNLWLVAFALTTTATYPLFLTRPPLVEVRFSPRPAGSR